MHHPSIFDDPKIHNLLHKKSIATGGTAADALNEMEVKVEENARNTGDNFKLLQSVRETANANTAAIGAVAHRLDALDQKLNNLTTVANDTFDILDLLVNARK